MNVYNYVDEYGKYTFNEKPLNLVDTVILSFLSYVNFDKIVLPNQKISMFNAAIMHKGLHSSKERHIIAVGEAQKLLWHLHDTNRYRDCLLYNFEYVGTKDLQFGAICFEYMKNKVFVSFEGTDQLISGWKEDLILSYQYPTISHLKAIEYINKHFTLSTKELIVGGHSKGGNLALVASMEANFLVRHKIKHIYNVDGPGLLEEQFNSDKYKRILDKYNHVVSEATIIGAFLHNSKEIVVKANAIGMFAHNIATWEVKNTSFEKSIISAFSREMRNDTRDWLKKYTKEELNEFVINLEKICDRANITSLLELRERKRNILKLISEAKDLDEKSKDMFEELVQLVIGAIGDTTKEEIKNFIKI